MTNWRSHWFACLEFKLEANTAAKMFASDDTPHYTTIGHNDAACPAITEKRVAHNTTLSNYLADNEMFDGELVFADPWPCAKCIPTEKLPKWEPTKERVKEREVVAPATSRLKPYRTGDKKPVIKDPDAPATDGQVRNLMRLYRLDKPNSTFAQRKAAEDRARAMTKGAASALIDTLTSKTGA